jgi:hypothetical protein
MEQAKEPAARLPYLALSREQVKQRGREAALRVPSNQCAKPHF